MGQPFSALIPVGTTIAVAMLQAMALVMPARLELKTESLGDVSRKPPICVSTLNRPEASCRKDGWEECGQ